ncbi:MAG: DUF6653 family protein [Pseudomonadota bacterium]
MNDETWTRHSNPWSGWTRVSILPLFCLAIWSRVWLGWYCLWLVLIVAIWTWVNPRFFGPPKHENAWMTKGVLGERIWLAKSENPIPAHHLRVGKLLLFASGIAAIILIYGLWRLDFGWTIAGLIGTMGAKLWFVDRMVWLLADMRPQS